MVPLAVVSVTEKGAKSFILLEELNKYIGTHAHCHTQVFRVRYDIVMIILIHEWWLKTKKQNIIW